MEAVKCGCGCMGSGQERIVLSPSELGLEAGDHGAWWPFCTCRYCGPEPICKAMPGGGTALLGCLVRVHPTMLQMRNGLCGECWEASKGEPDEPNEPAKERLDIKPTKGRLDIEPTKKDEPDEPQEPSKDETTEPTKGRLVNKPTKRRLVIKPTKG